jgi:hypothetical protein
MSDSKIRYTHVRDIGIGANGTNPEESTLEQIEVNAPPAPPPSPAAATNSQSASKISSKPAPPPLPPPAAATNSQSASKISSRPNTQVETLHMPPPPLDTKNEDDEREIKEDVFHERDREQVREREREQEREREREQERERERERTHSRAQLRWNLSLFQKSGAESKEIPKDKYNLAKQVSALSNPHHNAIAIGTGLSLLGFTLWTSNLPSNS